MIVLNGGLLHRLHHDAHVGLAGHVAVFDQVLGDLHGVVDGNGKAQSLGVGIGVFGGDDAHDLTPGVVHGAAGVAVVDRRGELEHIDLRGGVGVDDTVLGAHDAVADGVGQLTQRIAHTVHVVAHLQGLEIADGSGAESRGVDLQNGHVVLLLIAHDLRRIGGAVLEHDVHVISHQAVLDDVVIRQDIAVLRDDKAGAGHGKLAGAAEEVGVVGGAGDADADHLLAGHGVQIVDAHGLAGSGGLRRHVFIVHRRGRGIGGVENHLVGGAGQLAAADGTLDPGVGCRRGGAGAGAGTDGGRGSYPHNAHGPFFPVSGFLFLFRLLFRRLGSGAVIISVMIGRIGRLHVHRAGIDGLRIRTALGVPVAGGIGDLRRRGIPQIRRLRRAAGCGPLFRPAAVFISVIVVLFVIHDPCLRYQKGMSFFVFYPW